MRRVDKLLLALILCEVLAVGYVAGCRLQAPQPPHPDLSLVDSITARDLQSLQQQTWLDTSGRWLNLGKAYATYGFFPEADLCFSRASKLDSSSLETAFWWGMTLDRQGQPEAAIEKFQQAAALSANANPEQSFRCWYNIGRNYLRLEKPAEAEEAFQQSGHFSPAVYELAKVLLRTDRPKEVLALCDRLERENADWCGPYILRMDAYRLLGDEGRRVHARDLADYSSESLNLDVIASDLTRNNMNIGIGRLRHDVISENLKTHPSERTLDQWKTLVHTRWNRGAEYAVIDTALAIKRPNDALDAARNYIEHEGPSPFSIGMLGDIYRRMGDEAKARELWERAAQMRSTSELHMQLADYYRRHNDPENDKRHRALTAQASGIEATVRKQFDVAVLSLTEATSIDPSLAHSWFYLGELFRLSGKQKQAEAAYARCLKINPYHGRALRGQKLLATEKGSRG